MELLAYASQPSDLGYADSEVRNQSTADSTAWLAALSVGSLELLATTELWAVVSMQAAVDSKALAEVVPSLMSALVVAPDSWRVVTELVEERKFEAQVG